MTHILRDRAKKANEAGNFEEAFRLWSELAAEERDAIDYCRAGSAAHKLERWNDAWNAYEHALKIDSSCGEAMALLGSLFRKRTDGERRANLLQAKEWYLRALEIERKARWLFFLGATYAELKEIAAASDAFKQAIALRPGYDEAYLNLALLNMYECDNPQLAREYLGKAIELDPSYAEAYLYLAELGKDENPQEAGRLLEKAIELDPNCAEAYFNLAMLTEEHNPQEALRLLEKAIEINPSYGAAHQQLGNLLHKQGQLVDAEYHFRRSLEIDPADYFSHLYLANLLAVQDQDEEAEKMYRAAIALPQEDGAGYEFFANFLDDLTRHDEAKHIRARKPAAKPPAGASEPAF